MRLRFLLVVIVVFLLPATTILAASDYKIELSQVDVSDYPRITLYLSITDAAGQPVAALQQEEFSVFEDGQQVPILDFAGIGDERPVDVVFVFDTTGSMREQIEGVKERCIAFAEELNSKGRDYRLGLVTFWDTIQGVYNDDHTLTSDVGTFKGWIEGLRATGGDDTPELALEAMVEGSQMRFRDDAQRVLILITDAPPHHSADSSGFSHLTVDETLDQLRAARVTLFSVAPDLSRYGERFGLPARNEYGRLADELGGKFYDLDREPDFTAIIDEIGGLIASQYSLTYESARPSHDGTRRGIEVKVGEVVATGVYLEEHLLNIRSELLIGVAFLAPLLLALAVPSLLPRKQAARAAPSPAQATPPPWPAPPPEQATPPPWSAPPPEQPAQPTWPVPPPEQARPPAQPTQPTWPAPTPAQPTQPTAPPPSPAPPPTQPAQAISCPRCGNPLRPEARFCGSCGFSQSDPSASPQPHALACPNCGQSVRPGVRFCGSCGHQL